MTITFQISYRTDWGQSLQVKLSAGQQIKMLTPDGEHWYATLEVETPLAVMPLSYTYRVMNEKGEVVIGEDARNPRVVFSESESIVLQDYWENNPIEPVLLRSPFKSIGKTFSPKRLRGGNLVLRLRTLPAPAGKHWAVSGDAQAFGNWQKSCELQQIDTYCYQFEAPLSRLSGVLSYKYQLVDNHNPNIVEWESGENRIVDLSSISHFGEDAESGMLLVHTDVSVRLESALWRGSGVVVPVFSLRSKNSFGIGDFGDLKEMVNWVSSVGMRVLQLLPINDTTASGTWHDSYPYNCVSVFALHPIYLDLNPWRGEPLFEKYSKEGERLNRYPQVDYEGVFKLKMDFLSALYAQEKGTLANDKRYAVFKTENEEWLLPYAAFSAFREKFRTADFDSWKGFERYNASDVLALLQTDVVFAERVALYQYIQYVLAGQMQGVHEHANSCGVLLKGDIPIGVSRHSVPTWADSQLFFYDGQAGAPPDDFAVNGQNWGFPTYNWEAMAVDGYAWWRRRLVYMGKFFDAYRIDHVLGFFRIWEIPVEQHYGVLGYFRPAMPLTTEEIAERGFTMSPESLSRPRIAEGDLRELENGKSKWALSLKPYLDRHPDGTFMLKSAYATQAQIASMVKDNDSRQALMEIAANVLFVEDKERRGTFHPRIVGQKTMVYRDLGEADKRAFDAIYEDYFYHRHNAFWARKAMEKLPALIDSNDLIVCAEDLGMVPDCVKEVLLNLHILSLEIQRMPKAFGREFADLSENPYLSVATIATHDMPPLQKWWAEHPAARQSFWTNVLGRSGVAPESATAEVCRQVVEQHLASPSMFCLLSIQNWLSIDETLRSLHPEDEQINDPANANQNWNYRMKIAIEQLVGATDFNEKLRGMIALSGR